MVKEGCDIGIPRIDLETDLLPLLGAREGAGTRGRLEFLAGESADLAEYPGK